MNHWSCSWQLSANSVRGSATFDLKYQLSNFCCLSFLIIDLSCPCWFPSAPLSQSYSFLIYLSSSPWYWSQFWQCPSKPWLPSHLASAFLKSMDAHQTSSSAALQNPKPILVLTNHHSWPFKFSLSLQNWILTDCVAYRFLHLYRPQFHSRFETDSNRQTHQY